MNQRGPRGRRPGLVGMRDAGSRVFAQSVGTGGKRGWYDVKLIGRSVGGWIWEGKGAESRFAYPHVRRNREGQSQIYRDLIRPLGGGLGLGLASELGGRVWLDLSFGWPNVRSSSTREPKGLAHRALALRDFQWVWMRICFACPSASRGLLELLLPRRGGR